MEIQARSNVYIDVEYQPVLLQKRIEQTTKQDVTDINQPRDMEIIPYAKRTVDSLPNYLPEWANSLSEFRVSSDFCLPHFLVIKTIDPITTPAWGGDVSMSTMSVNTLSKGKVLSANISEWATSEVSCPNVEAHLGLSSGGSDYFTYLGEGTLKNGTNVNVVSDTPITFQAYMHSSTQFLLDGKPVLPGEQVRNRGAYVEKAGYAIVRSTKFQKTANAGEKEITQLVNILRHKFLPQAKIRRYERELMGDKEMSIRKFTSGFSSSKQTGGSQFFKDALSANGMTNAHKEKLTAHFNNTVSNHTHTDYDEESCVLEESTGFGSSMAPNESCKATEIYNLMMTTETWNPWHHSATFAQVMKNNHIKCAFAKRDDVIKVWPSRVVVSTQHTLKFAVNGQHFTVMEYTHTAPALFQGSVIQGGLLRKVSVHQYVVHFSYQMNILVSYCHCLDFTYDTLEEQIEVAHNVLNSNFSMIGQGLNCPSLSMIIYQRSQSTPSYCTSSNWFDFGQVVVTPYIEKSSGCYSSSGPSNVISATDFFDNVKTGSKMDSKLVPNGFFGDATQNNRMSEMFDLAAPKTYYYKEEVKGYQCITSPIFKSVLIKINSSAVQSTIPAGVLSALHLCNPDTINTIARHIITMPFDHRENAPRPTLAATGPHLPKANNITIVTEYNPDNSPLKNNKVWVTTTDSKNYIENAASYETEVYA